MPDGTLENSARQALRKGSFLLAFVFVLSFFVNVLRLAGPLFIILIYDRVLTSRSEETLFALFIMVAILIVTLGFLDFARSRIVARFAAQFQERLEQTILGAASQNDMFPEGKSKPAVGLEEADTLRGFFHSGGLISVMDFLWTPMFVAVIFFLHPTLGYVCLGGVAVMSALVFLRITLIGGREDRYNASSKRIGDLKNMVTASREVVRGQEMSTGFKNRWISAREDGRDHAIALRDWTSWFDHLSSTTLLLVRYTVLGTGAWLALQSQLTVGAMVACAFLVTRVLLPVNRFSAALPSIFKAIENWKRLRKILSGWDRAAAEPFSVEPGSNRVRLGLHGVSVRSPLTGAMALRSVSLRLAPGTMAEILGSSGQGKTALAEVIVGLARRTSGSILCDGVNVARMTDEEMSKAIGYVPETPRFIAGTIAENISRLDPEVTPLKVSAAARQACLHAWISALPDGYQTELDCAATTLSQGQRQQISLARALYFNPQILIVDEPDGMLLERLPKTMKKTFDSMLARDAVILLLARKPLKLDHDRQQFTLNEGELGEPKKVRARTGDAPTPEAAPKPGKVTVLADKSIRKGNA